MTSILGTQTISIVKQALEDIKGRVERGEILDKEAAQELAQLEALGITISKIRGNDTRNMVMQKNNLVDVTDKWRLSPATTKTLPECYRYRFYFEPKGGERTYIQVFEETQAGQPMLAYTQNVALAKLFRSHIGFAGKGYDFDCYHTVKDFMRTFFTMDGRYRNARGSEHWDDSAPSTQFVVETLDGEPHLTFVLIKIEA